MEYNGKKGMHTTVFLNEAHARMYQKYKLNSDSGDKKQAKELQDFFQNLKIAADNINNLPDGVDKSLYSQLLEEINKQLVADNLSTGTKNLFKRTGISQVQGMYFERELTAVIQAIALKASGGIQLPAELIHTGTQTGTTTLSDEIIQAINEGIEKGLNEEQAFKQATLHIDPLAFEKRVAIKTDVQGVQVDISAEVLGTNLGRIQELLSQATFSAKSYASKGWNKQTEAMEDIQDIYPNIHLGKSDPFRAVYGALTSLGYSQSTATSGYSAASNLTKKGNQNVINHIYHLRYMYELTGAGTKSLTGNVKEARFLIYNDPSTNNIYVKSTAEILVDLFDSGSD